MYRHGVLGIAIGLCLVGAGLAVGAGLKSRDLTGEWLGYPLPNHVAAAGGIGLLALVLGAMLLGAYVALVIADRPAVRQVLKTEIASDDHLLAQFGKSVLRAQRAWDTTIGLLLLILIFYAATEDRLVAAILAVTFGIVVVIYLLARRRRE